MKHLIKQAVSCVALAGCAVAAQAQIAVVMNPSAAPLSKDQVANIYLGRSFDLKPLDLPESSPAREQFYKKATDRDLSQVKATWSRIVFTGKGQPPKEQPNPPAVKKTPAHHPNTH